MPDFDVIIKKLNNFFDHNLERLAEVANNWTDQNIRKLLKVAGHGISPKNHVFTRDLRNAIKSYLGMIGSKKVYLLYRPSVSSSYIYSVVEPSYVDGQIASFNYANGGIVHAYGDDMMMRVPVEGWKPVSTFNVSQPIKDSLRKPQVQTVDPPVTPPDPPRVEPPKLFNVKVEVSYHPRKRPGTQTFIGQAEQAANSQEEADQLYQGKISSLSIAYTDPGIIWEDDINMVNQNDWTYTDYSFKVVPFSKGA